MDKIETLIKTRTVKKHNFYCDECGKYLGSIEELDDGYYNELGSYRMRCCIDSKWYMISKNFCQKCKSEYLQKLKNSLCNLGFIKE